MNTAYRPARWVLAGVAAFSLMPYALADAPQRPEAGEKPVIVLARARPQAAKARAEKSAMVRESDQALAAALENIAEDNRTELEMRLVDLTLVNNTAGN